MKLLYIALIACVAISLSGAHRGREHKKPQFGRMRGGRFGGPRARKMGVGKPQAMRGQIERPISRLLTEKYAVTTIGSCLAKCSECEEYTSCVRSNCSPCSDAENENVYKCASLMSCQMALFITCRETRQCSECKNSCIESTNMCFQSKCKDTCRYVTNLADSSDSDEEEEEDESSYSEDSETEEEYHGRNTPTDDDDEEDERTPTEYDDDEEESSEANYETETDSEDGDSERSENERGPRRWNAGYKQRIRAWKNKQRRRMHGINMQWRPSMARFQRQDRNKRHVSRQKHQWKGAQCKQCFVECQENNDTPLVSPTQPGEKSSLDVTIIR